VAQRAAGGFLDRFLRLFTEVRAGEGLTALLLTFNVFLVMTSYYIIKPIRDALILTEQGPEVYSYLNAGTVMMLALVVPLYGRLADKLPRRRLINTVTWIYAAFLGLFFVLGGIGVPLGIPFFVYASMFGVMILAQFWSFANDIYRRDEGERLFPIVAFGASLGGVLGVTVVEGLIESFDSIYLPLVIAAVILLLQLQITNYVDGRERKIREAHLPDVKTTATIAASGVLGAPKTIEELEELAEQERAVFEARKRGEDVEEPEAPSGLSAFGLVWNTRYLLLISLLVMSLNWVNTNGQYILGRAVTDAVLASVADPAQQGPALASFYASFYRVQNIAGLLIQLFLVSRIIKFIGIRWAIMVLPTIALGAYVTIAFLPLLGAIRWAKTVENATDYSLNNTVRHALFLPTTREQKYKGKQVSDAVFHRAGDLLSSVTVFVGVTFIGLGTMGFALFNIGLVVGWLLVAWRVGAEYRRLVASGRPPRTRGAAPPPHPFAAGQIQA
jgi:AAA family ATP:ADP antiporter